MRGFKNKKTVHNLNNVLEKYQSKHIQSKKDRNQREQIIIHRNYILTEIHATLRRKSRKPKCNQKKKKKIEKRPTATVKCIRLLKTSLE